MRCVDGNEWVGGKGMRRRENTTQYALLSAVINSDESDQNESDQNESEEYEYDNLILNVEDANETTEHPNNGAWWIDHTADEVGSMNSMLPIVNIGYNAY